MTRADKRREGAAKANDAKREKWKQLVTDPMAERMMQLILAIEADCLHAERHIPRIWNDCPPSCPLHPDPELTDAVRGVYAAAYRARAVADLMRSELRAAFIERFSVSQGYFKRFRSHVQMADLNRRRALDEADRLTDEDRAALARWMETGDSAM